MTPTVQIIVLWLAFAGSHLLLSSLPVRSVLIGRIGETAFRGLYSLIAFAFFIPLTAVYFSHRHEGPALWSIPPGPGVRWFVYVVMAVSFVLLVASFVQPSPAALGAPGETTARGVLRLTRHPLLMALGLFGLVHLLPNGYASDVAYFAGFAAFTVVGAWHQDRRKLATQPEFRAFYDQTPFFPFTGRHTLEGVRELPIAAVAIALLLTIGIRWLHGPLFGS